MKSSDNLPKSKNFEVSRRNFLKAASSGALGYSIANTAHATQPNLLPNSGDLADRAVILLMLVGGPSQLETFDPKPDAPERIRGPFQSIATAVPGIRVGEHLPRLAQRMNHLTLIRSMHHDAAPIHETGQQILQTGRLCRLGEESPHFGSIASFCLGPQGAAPPFVILPKPIGHTGVNISHGQSAGLLGLAHDPFVPGNEPARSGQTFNRALVKAFDLRAEPDTLRDAYGHTPFGQNCLLARRLVEAGTRVVVVNMYETIFQSVSWDCHGRAPFSTLEDYALEVLPTFDRAFSALLDDLNQRGRLDSTLVVATGEFGRSPLLNADGGRNHWPGVWSAALAGGGIPGGQIIGASDSQAGEPADGPVSPVDLLATIYQGMGIDPTRDLPLTNGRHLAIIDDGEPIAEIFA